MRRKAPKVAENSEIRIPSECFWLAPSLIRLAAKDSRKTSNFVDTRLNSQYCANSALVTGSQTGTACRPETNLPAFTETKLPELASKKNENPLIVVKIYLKGHFYYSVESASQAITLGAYSVWKNPEKWFFDALKVLKRGYRRQKDCILDVPCAVLLSAPGPKSELQQ